MTAFRTGDVVYSVFGPWSDDRRKRFLVLNHDVDIVFVFGCLMQVPSRFAIVLTPDGRIMRTYAPGLRRLT